MTVLDVRPEHSMLAFVNAAIAQLQRRLGLTDAEFFCECGSTLCSERIRLSRADYARVREAGPVTIAGHAVAVTSPLPPPVAAAAPEAAAMPSAGHGEPAGSEAAVGSLGWSRFTTSASRAASWHGDRG